MNSESTEPQSKSVMSWVIAFAGAFLIMAALVWATRRYTEAPPVGAERAAERARALAERVGLSQMHVSRLLRRSFDAMRTAEQADPDPGR